MSISFTCSGCGEQVIVGDDRAGTKGRCRRCGNAYRVPVPASAAEARKPPSVYGLAPEPPSPSPGSEPAAKPLDANKVRVKVSTPNEDEESSQKKSQHARALVFFHGLFVLAVVLTCLRREWDSLWLLIPGWLIATLAEWASRRRTPGIPGVVSVGLGVVACVLGAGCGAFLYWALGDIRRESIVLVPIILVIWAVVAYVVWVLAIGGFQLGRQALALSRGKRHKAKWAWTLALLGLSLNGLGFIAPLAMPLFLYLFF
jgi:hypothetical protein